MKEIANILGVSKPTLFRFLKANSFHEAFKKRNTNMYDETTDEMFIESLKEQISLLKKHDEEQKELL